MARPSENTGHWGHFLQIQRVAGPAEEGGRVSRQAVELMSVWLAFQNVCFIFPQFLYQFFCGFSQQVRPTVWGQKLPGPYLPSLVGA